MIADTINNEKLNSIVTELLISGRKLNISLAFIAQSYFKVLKDVRLNTTYFLIMKIPNKRELQQIALTHSSDIDFKDFIKVYKKCTDKPLMTTDDQIKDEKLQYDFNRETAKISALSSGKIHKYEYLTDEDILPSNQQKIIELAKFTYSPLGKTFEKQTKTIQDQEEKQIKAINTLKSNEKLAIEDIIPKSAFANEEAKKELDKIKEIEKNVIREKMIYDASEYANDFRNFRTIRTFGRDIYNDKITLMKINQI